MNINVPESISTPEINRIEPSGIVSEGQKIATIKCSEGGDSYELIVQKECTINWHDDNSNFRKTIGSYRAYSSIDESLLGIWMSSHSAFRGIQTIDGQGGHGGHVSSSLVPVHVEIYRDGGLEQIVEALKDYKLQNGDSVVIGDKIIAITQGRIIEKAYLKNIEPKFLSREERITFAKQLSYDTGIPITEKQLILIDFLDENYVSLGAKNYNMICYEISNLIYRQLGVKVDVVISDSDTGVDVAEPLIGIPTVGSTPLGSTKGLTIYEAIRISAAAELIRGHNRGIPIVISKSHSRNVIRDEIGNKKDYNGMLDVFMESHLHRGLKTTLYWRKIK